MAHQFKIGDVLDHFDEASLAASQLDEVITIAANNLSANYGPPLLLSLRQALGPLDFTVGRDSSGNFNTSDVKVFMKNLGGIGSGG